MNHHELGIFHAVEENGRQYQGAPVSTAERVPGGGDNFNKWVRRFAILTSEFMLQN